MDIENMIDCGFNKEIRYSEKIMTIRTPVERIKNVHKMQKQISVKYTHRTKVKHERKKEIASRTQLFYAYALLR